MMSACPIVQKVHVWVNVPNKMIAWVRKQARVRVLLQCDCGGRGSSGGGGEMSQSIAGGVVRGRSTADSHRRALQSGLQPQTTHEHGL